jgi:hypothetical protein
MAIWALVLLVVLMIPVLAIVIDSEFGRAFARRISREADEADGALEGRVAQLEGEVRYLSETLETVRDETVFLRSLLEDDSPESRALPTGE